MWILVGFGVVVMVGVAIGRDFADRTPRLDRQQLEEITPPEAEPQEPPTMEERIAEIERLVDRLYRITDPFEHRDEMRLERRVRELEDQVERMEREIRRLETQVRR